MQVPKIIQVYYCKIHFNKQINSKNITYKNTLGNRLKLESIYLQFLKMYIIQ